MTNLLSIGSEETTSFVFGFLIEHPDLKEIIEDEDFSGIMELPELSDGFDFDGKKFGIVHRFDTTPTQLAIYTNQRRLSFYEDDVNFPQNLYDTLNKKR